MKPPFLGIVGRALRLTPPALALLVVALTPSTVQVINKADVCDSRLKPSAGDLGYRMRDISRCEGQYQQDVGSPSELVLAGLSSVPRPPSAWSNQMAMFWAPGFPSAVRIVATPLLPRAFYQMDAVVARGQGVYKWPTDVIRHTEYEPDDLGVVAFQESPERVYVALSFDTATPHERQYEAIVICGATLSSIQAVVRRESSATVVHSMARKPDLRYFPAETPIRLRFALPREEGRYRVTVSTVGFESTATGSLSFVMYAPAG